jgi:site-specific DNA-methyltransferase (adenine-specific)
MTHESSTEMAPVGRIRFGDARDPKHYRDLAPHLVVTSPPYWSIKDYGTVDQIGATQDYETYVEDLHRVWTCCYEALLPGCKICINVGDQFLRAKEHGRYRVLPIRERIISSLMSLGADYMGAIIWRKMTTTHTSGGGTLMGSYPHPRNGILKIDYEFILVFKKPGKAPRPTPEQKESSRMDIEEWSRNFTAHWDFPGERARTHHAMFPLELPRRLIRMFTFPGEQVLDPFAGSGTSIRAAIEEGRRGEGIELNRDFQAAIADRLGPVREQVVFEGEGGETRRAPESEFFGTAHRLEDVGRDRYDGAGRVEAIVGPIALRVGEKTWRLEGLLEPSHPEPCQRALQDLVGRQRVLVEPTTEDRAYVRLSNRTLVNARLIHMGVADPDPARSHRNRSRFLRYARERE